jgi:hypothetical protein
MRQREELDRALDRDARAPGLHSDRRQSVVPSVKELAPIPCLDKLVAGPDADRDGPRRE